MFSYKKSFISISYRKINRRSHNYKIVICTNFDARKYSPINLTSKHISVGMLWHG